MVPIPIIPTVAATAKTTNLEPDWVRAAMMFFAQSMDTGTTKKQENNYDGTPKNEASMCTFEPRYNASANEAHRFLVVKAPALQSFRTRDVPVRNLSTANKAQSVLIVKAAGSIISCCAGLGLNKNTVSNSACRQRAVFIHSPISRFDFATLLVQKTGENEMVATPVVNHFSRHGLPQHRFTRNTLSQQSWPSYIEASWRY
jgi:hypothetical protein